MRLPQTSIIPANWPAPQHIQAFTTTRFGGFSQAPYAQLNLGFHLADEPQHVAQNSNLIQAHLGAQTKLNWLQQTHSTKVVHAAQVRSMHTQADAMYTSQPQLACSVLTADCLPLLLCTKDGEEIAAVHAGWRGLAAGIVSRTLEQFKQPPENILVWLGPAIGPQSFEVGAEVRAAFITSLTPLCAAPLLIEQAFSPVASVHDEVTPKFLADIYQLARLELFARGVTNVYGGGLCTVRDERFYSYRREQNTGRMATIIVRDL